MLHSKDLMQLLLLLLLSSSSVWSLTALDAPQTTYDKLQVILSPQTAGHTTSLPDAPEHEAHPQVAYQFSSLFGQLSSTATTTIIRFVVLATFTQSVHLNRSTSHAFHSLRQRQTMNDQSELQSTTQTFRADCKFMPSRMQMSHFQQSNYC